MRRRNQPPSQPARARGRHRGTGGLAVRTVRHIHALLREALQEAVHDGLLTVSPAAAVKLPKIEAREMRALDEAQVRTLLEAAQGHRLYPLVVLALLSGLRPSELLGLRWRDLDLEAGTLVVRQVLTKTRQGGVAFKAPKTEKSRRQLTLPPLAVEALRRHRRVQAKARLAAGPAWQDHGDLVFTRPGVRPVNPTWTSKAVSRLARAAGLPAGVSLHTCRHAHGSILLGQGVPLPEVSRRLGHANVAITAAIYSHALPKQDPAAASRLDAALRAAGMTAPEA